MNQKNGIIIRLLSLALTLALVLAVGSPASGSWPQPDGDPWAAKEAAARERTQAVSQVAGQSTPSGQPVSSGQPALHQGHLGYDKATGQRLEDPTIQVDPVQPAAVQALSLEVAAQKLKGVKPEQIRFRSGYTIELEPGIPTEVMDDLQQATADNPQGDYYVIQFSFPFPTQARSELEAAGVAFYDYMDTAALYARVPPQAAATLERLAGQGLVRTVSRIPAQARLDPSLTAAGLASPDAPAEVTLLTFETPTAEQLAELGQWMTVERFSDGPIHILEGQAASRDLPALSGLGYVRWIEPQLQYELHNLEGGMGVGADVVRQTGYNGTGVNVMVVDTGIARSGSTYHPDLPASRILDQYDYQALPNDTVADDQNGHGTHTAGTVGGKYNPANSNSRRSWQGVAPGVNFNIYKLCCGLSQFSSVWFTNAFLRGTSDGRVTNISSNSWGSLTAHGAYNTNSEIADRAVRGEYNSQYINVVISSGNNENLTAPPGTAKNAITVGAVKDGNYPAVSITSCSTGAEYNWPPAEKVCYSNFGPVNTDNEANDPGRVKPDVMAPGAMITSAAPWYLWTDNRYYTPNQGTSMAAPHVAGVIAQILEAYSETNGWLFSWPEVVKAMLLANTVDVGGDTNNYGHGLVDPYHTIFNQPGVTAPMSFWGETMPLTGDARNFTYNVPAGYQQVRVVLTWPDPSGPTEVINDLDILSVIDSNGALCGTAATYEDTVEYAVIDNSTCIPGDWTITVNGYSLISTQTFGLAAVAILADTDLVVSSAVEYIPGTATSVAPGQPFYLHEYVTNNGFAGGGAYLRLTLPVGFAVQGVRIYTADGHSYLYQASQIYHVTGSPYWRLAVGQSIKDSIRHVRWTLSPVNHNLANGTHSLVSHAYWMEGGDPWVSGTNSANVSVSSTNPVFLPFIRR